jgi:hypothetical protein
MVAFFRILNVKEPQVLLRSARVALAGHLPVTYRIETRRRSQRQPAKAQIGDAAAVPEKIVPWSGGDSVGRTSGVGKERDQLIGVPIAS